MIDPIQLVATFRRLFKKQPRLFRAPGRVNLIGEHTDYNDGFVLPMAINHDVVVAAAERSDSLVRVHSVNLDETLEFDLSHSGPRQRGIWLDYVEGVAQVLIKKGVPVKGADLVIQSDVPVGSGLSSSAAVEVGVGYSLWRLAGTDVDLKELALAGQKAEHLYVGAMVGIMDQMTSAVGLAGHALLIDCRSLVIDQIPFGAGTAEILICDSRVKHEIASSAYNLRRKECEEAARILRAAQPDIRALRDVSVADFQNHQGLLSGDLKKRARHIVTENQRTLSAAEALRRNDFRSMGKLMSESHQSLRDDYEVSCFELDLLVKIATNVDGVYGARMTGGGFGGCTVNLVRRDAVEPLKKAIALEYTKQAGKVPLMYLTQAMNGVSEINPGADWGQEL